jgi:hypothetical protein
MTSTSRIIHSILNPPAPLNDGAYSGYYYAFFGEGGFSTDQSFNPILLNKQSSVSRYALFGEGGFSTDQSFNPILLNKQPSASFQLYDVTYAIQVKFDVRTINKKIGLIKDSSNIVILDSSYDVARNSFPTDSINVTASDFVNGMSAAQVISVGAYQTMYNEYMESVNRYFFKIPTLDDSLFSAASTQDISNGVFDANQFMELINQQLDTSHQYINPVAGFVTLSNINQLLRFAVDSDVFGNRVPLPNDASVNITPIDNSFNNTIHFTEGTVTDASTNITTSTQYDSETNTETVTIQDNSNNTTTVIVYDLSENTITTTTNTAGQSGNSTGNVNTGTYSNPIKPSYADVSFSTIPENFGIGNGFLAGDLIFIPGGMTSTLQILIDPMIDASTSSIYDLILNSGLAYDYAIDLSNIATQKTTMIQKILTAPLLIELANLS